MTDDLANQLRQRASKPLSATPVSLLEKAADRIEELGAKHQETFQMYVDANEARIDAEAKLAKLRTFLDELWDSQGYDARELHDLLKELDGVSDD